MSQNLLQFTGCSSQPRKDVGTATSYFLYVSSMLQDSRAEGNAQVTYDASKKEWSSDKFVLKASLLKSSWEALITSLYKHQQTPKVPLMEKSNSFEVFQDIRVSPFSGKHPKS